MIKIGGFSSNLLGGITNGFRSPFLEVADDGDFGPALMAVSIGEDANDAVVQITLQLRGFPGWCRTYFSELEVLEGQIFLTNFSVLNFKNNSVEKPPGYWDCSTEMNPKIAIGSLEVSPRGKPLNLIDFGDALQTFEFMCREYLGKYAPPDNEPPDSKLELS